MFVLIKFEKYVLWWFLLVVCIRGVFIYILCMYMHVLYFVCVSVFVAELYVLCSLFSSVYILILLLIIGVKGKKGIHLFKIESEREREWMNIIFNNVKRKKISNEKFIHISMYVCSYTHIHTIAYMYILREKKIKCNKNYDHTAQRQALN